VAELGCGDPGSGNLLVEGDNLHALKALLPYYAGQVKCIYIDPPYNTGNEGWVYNDAVNSPLIQKWLGETVGKEAEDLSRHDKWLCMMLPRLQLLKQFLREDGAIFVSLDDNEIQSLRFLMDEVFGKENFVATVIWQKVYSPKNSAKHFSEDHDYIVVYEECGDMAIVSGPAKRGSRFGLQESRQRSEGPWKTGDLSARNFYSQGTYADSLSLRTKLSPDLQRVCIGGFQSHGSMSLTPTNAFGGEKTEARFHKSRDSCLR